MNQEEHTLLIIKLNLKQQWRSSLCDYSDAYIHRCNTAADADAKIQIKKQYSKIVLHLHLRICRINNTQVDNSKYIDIIMPVYNLIEYSNNYGNIVKM